MMKTSCYSLEQNSVSVFCPLCVTKQFGEDEWVRGKHGVDKTREICGIYVSHANLMAFKYTAGRLLI